MIELTLIRIMNLIIEGFLIRVNMILEYFSRGTRSIFLIISCRGCKVTHLVAGHANPVKCRASRV